MRLRTFELHPGAEDARTHKTPDRRKLVTPSVVQDALSYHRKANALHAGRSIWCIFQLVSVQSAFPNSLGDNYYTELGTHTQSSIKMLQTTSGVSCMPAPLATPYRLALDLGSTSLGWAILRLAPTGDTDYKLKPTAIIRAGVRIFSDGRNPKDGSSLAVTRRAARAMRRRRDRLLRRKVRMTEKLVEHGFFPADQEERKKLEVLNPYELRAKGLDHALTPGEFARALFHINQRRGFKSNRKTDKKENDSSALKAAINGLRQAMIDQDCRTVGELLYRRLTDTALPAERRTVRARYREKRLEVDGKNRIEKSYDLYVDRQMIADEFDALWNKQSALNPALFNEATRFDLRDTLLFQRPLRPVRPGRCTLIPDEERAPLALPSTQRFRIYQEVNHLRLLSESDLQQRVLTRMQRDQIVEALEKNTKRSFDQLRKLLGLDGTVRFNLEDEKRKELKGNSTSSTLAKKEYFGSAWYEFDSNLQDEIVMQLLMEESEARLVNWLRETTGLSEERALATANTGLPEGYGSLSRKALERIVPALIDCDLVEDTAIPRTYDKAVLAAGFDHHSKLGFSFDFDDDEVEQLVDVETGEITPIFKQLPYYGKALQRHVAFEKENPRNDEERYGKIANPTVHIGLNQVRIVINSLIRRYGRPTEIVVELARDLKQSREQKLETHKRQAENQRRNERIRKAIATVLDCNEERVKRADIQKWILWEELSYDVADRRCPYSGIQISANMLLSDEVEIEHILPFSMTLDDTLNNKTVCMRRVNRVKGNKTPWQARDDFAHQGWFYTDIEHRASRMPKAKRYRFGADGYEQWLRDDKGFLARALNDTRYLSRITKEYLSLICPGSGVRVIPGQMTAMLRQKFGLNDVLGLRGEKNRNDHRHHAVDACVIGVTDQGLLQRFANANATTRCQGITRLVEDMPKPWSTYYDHVERAVRNIWVSHKPDHGHEGAMHNDTAYGLLGEGRVFTHKRIDGIKQRIEENLKVLPFANAKIIHATNKPWFNSPHHNPDAPYKGYKGDSNYCVEITENEKGKWEGKIISTYEAYQLAKNTKGNKSNLLSNLNNSYGLNGNKLIARLMRGDMVRILHEGETRTLRIAFIKSSGQMGFADHNESNVDKRTRQKEMSYILKTPGTFQTSYGRKIFINPDGVLTDPGSSF